MNNCIAARQREPIYNNDWVIQLLWSYHCFLFSFVGITKLCTRACCFFHVEAFVHCHHVESSVPCPLSGLGILGILATKCYLLIFPTYGATSSEKSREEYFTFISMEETIQSWIFKVMIKLSVYSSMTVVEAWILKTELYICSGNVNAIKELSAASFMAILSIQAWYFPAQLYFIFTSSQITECCFLLIDQLSQKTRCCLNCHLLHDVTYCHGFILFKMEQLHI